MALTREARVTLAKILLVVGVIAAVYFIVRAYTRALAAKQRESAAKPTEDMVQCAHCGVHLPRGDSIAEGSRYFCSTEHRQLHGP